MNNNHPTKPVDQKKNSVGKKITLAHSYQYSGPIPHPSLLNQYDLKTRSIIVNMAKDQSFHRQSIEAAVISSNIWNERVGMFIAAFITLFMIGGGIYLLMNNKNVVGFLLVFGTAGFQAGNYIYNKSKENEVVQDKKNKEKND